MIVTPPAPITEDAVLVRVAVQGRGWPRLLPATPRGVMLTVTVGHPRLLPVAEDELRRAGYRVAGVTDARQPLDRSIDVLVPTSLHETEPIWWAALFARAERVFDLRHGPVQHVLAPQLALHARALES